MRRVLKIVGYGVLAVVVLLAIAVGVLALKKPKMRPAQQLTIQATPEQIAHGKYLAENVTGCMNCHSEHDKSTLVPKVVNAYAGAPCEGNDGPMNVCIPNITPAKSGIGEWTDGEVLRAMREGVDRNGRPLFPLMEKYHVLSDQDAMDIVAYLRTLPPVETKPQESHFALPVRLLLKLAPTPLDGPVATPSKDDKVAYGKYLATIASCKGCHSPGGPGEPDEETLFQGGNDFSEDDSGTDVSTNITPDPETGIGKLTEAQFVQLFRSYGMGAADAQTTAGHNLEMPWRTFAGMTDDDLKAIYAYLRTVKPMHNVITRGAQASK
jgi:mono/diheme cytochrome c family protein